MLGVYFTFVMFSKPMGMTAQAFLPDAMAAAIIIIRYIKICSELNQQPHHFHPTASICRNPKWRSPLILVPLI